MMGNRQAEVFTRCLKMGLEEALPGINTRVTFDNLMVHVKTEGYVGQTLLSHSKSYPMMNYVDPVGMLVNIIDMYRREFERRLYELS